MTVSRLARVLVGVAFVLVMPVAAWAQRYQPSLDFQTIETPHFWIHFHQGERDVAVRLASLAEQVRATLLAGRPLPEPGRTHVILSGQDDVPNGWATTVPFNLIEIRTIWPRPSSAISNSTDWLRLVFTHEYSHILHLDRSTGVFSLARHVFGRVPFAMPNLFLPVWQVEGIATWRESVTTGLGRVNDGTVRRVPAAALRAGAFAPIDRASGGLVGWPGGDAAYFYGSLFHEYLVQRFGAEALERLTAETARWPPFFGRFAYRRVFGASAESLWKDFERSWGGRAAGPADDSVVRITTDGYQTASPRWDRERPDTLLYSRRTPHAFPSIQRVGVASHETTTVARQFYGEVISVRGSRLVFDQLDLVSNVALESDLYLLDLDDVGQGGQPRRLTRGQRAGDADLAPDGSQIVFVVSAADRRALATLTIGDDGQPGEIVSLVSEPGVYFGRPRWSPDGRQVVAERQQRGRPAEIVVVEMASRSVDRLAPGVGDRQATPTWSPDGDLVIFAAARGNEPFNLVAASPSDRRAWRVTDRVDGARSPDVSPDGRRIAFVGYTTAGEDVFVAPFDRTAWAAIAAGDRGSPLVDEAERGDPEVGVGQAPALVSRPYSPLHGFVPRYWAPVVETGDDGVAVGAATAATDALGRHAYDLVASVWSETHQVDVDATYSYRRWRPWTFGAFSREVRTAEEGLVKSHTFSTGVVLPWVSVRHAQQLVGLFRVEQVSLETAEGETFRFRRNAVRLGWTAATEKSFGFSISSEEGWLLAASSEHVRRSLGADGNADSVFAEGRYFQRAAGRHAVLAVRGAGAYSRGDREVRQLFTVASNGPVVGPLSFDSDAVALFRGASTGRITGTRMAALNVDYRFPLWRVERGIGAYPAFFRWAHAAAFVDTADAWLADRSARPRVAVGAELAADFVLGYSLPLTAAVGVSWRVDRARPDNTPYVFGRVGRAF